MAACLHVYGAVWSVLSGMTRRPHATQHTAEPADTNNRAKGAGHRVTAKMMPIGVPKVPWKSPGENVWQWVDLWNTMYRERIIFIGKAIDDDMGNQLVGTMLYLDSDNSKDVMLYINAQGGDVVPTLAIRDTMMHMRSDVGTVAFGGAMAMPCFLLAMGKKGKRFAMPNTELMLHHPSGAARGQASDMSVESRELLRVRALMSGYLANQTGQPVEKVTKDLMRNCYYSPETAKEYVPCCVVLTHHRNH